MPGVKRADVAGALPQEDRVDVILRLETWIISARSNASLPSPPKARLYLQKKEERVSLSSSCIFYRANRLDMSGGVIAGAGPYPRTRLRDCVTCREGQGLTGAHACTVAGHHRSSNCATTNLDLAESKSAGCVELSRSMFCCVWPHTSCHFLLFS